MKYKTWFRLVLKAVGILLLGLALPELLQEVGGYMVYRATAFAPTGPLQDVLILVAWTVSPPVLQAAIGLYLLLGGKWVADFCVPSNRPYCPECGYDLSNTKDAGTCSECGTVQPKQP